VILFTKVPRPGLVKTRLIGKDGRPSGEDVSLLYESLLHDTLLSIVQFRRRVQVSLIVAFTPEDGESEMRRIVSEHLSDADYVVQEGSSVTERVRCALKRAFETGYDAVCLVPGDHPDLEESLLGEAFRHLSGGEPSVVVGPTFDGGAYLLGFNRNSYHDIDFSLEDTHLVCASLALASRAKGILVFFLENRRDIDSWEDARTLLGTARYAHTRTYAFLRSFHVPDSEEETGPKISVVVPTLNEERMIGSTLASLDRQELKDFEVIVVDGCSSDRTLEEVWGEADKIVIVRNPLRQRQENAGAMAARGEVLLFLHADTRPSPTVLKSVAASLERPSVVGGSCRVSFGTGGPKDSLLSALSTCGGRLLGIHGISSAFFVRRSAFLSVGSFREDVMEEGVDLQKRLSKFGVFVTLNDSVWCSARRFKGRAGTVPVMAVWIASVLLTWIGLHFTWVEKRLWRSVR
jgi:glycosyltransferase A (GT-A) superfamily protein (DUF2064 family)